MAITYPTVTIIIPQLGRPEGLQRCLQSIYSLDYPQECINTLVIADEGEQTVPEKVKKGVEMSTGEWICYAANDMEFTKDSLRIAIEAGLKNNKALVSFNEGALYEDNGNICTHFVIKRSVLDLLPNGEIFDCRYYHLGVDNILWARLNHYGIAMYCEDAKIEHHHFSRGSEFDHIYQKAYEHADHDRALLKEHLYELQCEGG